MPIISGECSPDLREAGSDAADVSELLRQLRGLLLEFRRVVTSLEALGVIDINYDFRLFKYGDPNSRPRPIHASS